jgi:predicted AAA+ superfamily ATPase
MYVTVRLRNATYTKFYLTTCHKNGSLIYNMLLFPRSLKAPSKSFFLFGARGVGKSTWLKNNFSKAVVYNLLDQRLFLRLSKDPGALKEELMTLQKQAWVVLDEIQKVPALLDVVHDMMEERELRFALSGSSARKLKRGGGNLLAGRAVTRALFPFTAHELGSKFNLKVALQLGLLPLVHNDPKFAKDTLTAYFQTYIREEVREEGLIRKTEPFLRFLEIAGLLNGQQVNASGIARDAMISRSIVDQYFSILEDTLVGFLLPAYRPKAKVREQGHPKFYWFDAGVARSAAGLLENEPEKEWLGRSFETLVLHELRSFLAYNQLNFPMFYYRTKNGVEVDFLIELKKATLSKPAEVITIEVKLANKWDSRWSALQPLSDTSNVKIVGSYGIYTGDKRLISNGMEIYPFDHFIRDLYQRKII